MNTEEWITARPPTDEEVGGLEECIVTTRNRRVIVYTGDFVRYSWDHVAPHDPVAWMPMPAPCRTSRLP